MSDSSRAGESDGAPDAGVQIRQACRKETLDCRRILDASLLQVEPGRIRERIDSGGVLVATVEPDTGGPSTDCAGTTKSGPTPAACPETVLGVLVYERQLSAAERSPESIHAPVTITQIAVRRRHRGRGIGTALVEAAASREPHLTAEFDRRVRDFWESVGFTLVALGDRNDRDDVPEVSTQLARADRFRGRLPASFYE